MRRQCSLALEAGKNAERVNAFRNAAGQRHVALAQQQHLRPLNQAGVAGGTGRADRVVRAGDAQVERDLAGRIVGHGARVVMVRPELRVVVETLELGNLVFGFDVAVFGNADVDADLRLVDVRPIEPRVGNCFLATINANAAGPRAAAEIFAFLILQFVELANTGQCLADIADFVPPHAAAAGQQVLAKLRQILPVGRSQAHSGNYDPLAFGFSGNHPRRPCFVFNPRTYRVSRRLTRRRGELGMVGDGRRMRV